MDQEKVDRAHELIRKIASLIRSPKNLKKEEMEKLADDILYWQVEFGAYLVEAEQAYRFLIRQLMEKYDLSYAAAENQAKTEQEYAIYKKIKYLYEVAEEKIRVLKLMIGGAY